MGVEGESEHGLPHSTIEVQRDEAGHFLSRIIGRFCFSSSINTFAVAFQLITMYKGRINCCRV